MSPRCYIIVVSYTTTPSIWLYTWRRRWSTLRKASPYKKNLEKQTLFINFCWMKAKKLDCFELYEILKTCFLVAYISESWTHSRRMFDLTISRLWRVKRFDPNNRAASRISKKETPSQSIIPTGSVHNTHRVAPWYSPGHSIIPTGSLHNFHRVSPQGPSFVYVYFQTFASELLETLPFSRHPPRESWSSKIFWIFDPRLSEILKTALQVFTTFLYF